MTIAEVGSGRHAWPEARWPVRDREAWATARLGGGPFDADGPASHWRPPTARLHVIVYGLWLDHLDRTGELNSMLAPGERATAPRLQAFITELPAAVTPVTVAGYVANLAGNDPGPRPVGGPHPAASGKSAGWPLPPARSATSASGSSTAAWCSLSPCAVSGSCSGPRRRSRLPAP